jgi:stringent starvation protein B
MANEPSSTKPYFLRAMYEWCLDNGFTPHLVVAVNSRTRVPQGYVKDGEIVLNINFSATKDLLIGNEAVTFSARFGGNPFDIYVPVDAVRGIFARETGQGMFFEADEAAAPLADGEPEDPPDGPPDEPVPPAGNKRPALKLVK